MIPNHWYIVLDSKEVPKNKPVGFRRFGKRLVFWRDSNGTVHCHEDQCCHRGAQLSLGRVVDGCLECPFHGWRFDSKGACTRIPSNGRSASVPASFSIERYIVREEQEWIWLYWGEIEDEKKLPDIPFFQDLMDPRFQISTHQEEWAVHYTRSIENQLDVTHLSFVHAKTIGDPSKTIADGPMYRWTDEQTLAFFPVNQVDKGQVARKAHEIEVTEIKGGLQFRFPNIWQLHIAEDFRNFAAFVPVDESHTVTYVRVYQRFFTVPILGGWVAWLMGKFNARVLGEDRPMVVSQLPISSQLEMTEKLVRGDAPIIEYRKRRHELLEAFQEGRSPTTIVGRSNSSIL